MTEFTYSTDGGATFKTATLPNGSYSINQLQLTVHNIFKNQGEPMELNQDALLFDDESDDESDDKQEDEPDEKTVEQINEELKQRLDNDIKDAFIAIKDEMNQEKTALQEFPLP